MAISFLRLALGAARLFVLPFHQLGPLSAAFGERRLSWSSDGPLLGVRSRQQYDENEPRVAEWPCLRGARTSSWSPCSGLIESLRDVLRGLVGRVCSGQWLAHFAPQGATAQPVQAPDWTASRLDAGSQPLKGFGCLRPGP